MLKEVNNFKDFMHMIDEKAFVTISQINEVKGRGFTMERITYDEVEELEEKKEKQEIIAIADVFRAKIVDVAMNSVMIELTGNQNKLDAFLNIMSDFEVLEMVRTGITGLGRGMSVMK